jgi:DNA-binding winged helix-turn-helix (wHTH) protein
VAVAFGEFEFEPEIPELRRAGRRVSLGDAPLRLLRALLERPGTPVSKDALMKAAWGRRVNSARLTSAMSELRQALEADQDEPTIATLSRIGYRFAANVATARTAAPPLASAPPPYVGRTPLLDQLRAALARADAGRGCMTVLVGEPGIGKTRLVEELSRELPEHVHSAWGYCREAGDTPPLWPWYELLDGLQSGGPDATSHERHAELLTRAALGAETTRNEAFERAAATIVHASAEAAWLLVLDDLHRVDAASLELLLRVADRIAHTRIHLVTTLRAHQVPASAMHAVLLSRVLEHPSCEQLVVGPLSAPEVATYVAAQVADPDGELAKAVYEKSEGNPFFMTELVRQLASATDRDAPAALRLPLAALDLMRQRVQDIDEQTRGLLSVCAVIGRTIPLDLLAEVLEQPRDAVRARLEEALRRGVLVAPDLRSLRFSHELIRSVVYDGIAPTLCRQWHARVALVLEQRRQQGREIAASEAAFHCHSALPLGDLQMAIRVCREAADEAAAAFGATDVAHYTHYALEALRLLPTPSVRLRMSLLYGVAIYSRPYDTATYARCAQELIELAHQCKNGEMLTRASALMDAHPRLEPLARTAIDPALAMDWLPPGVPGLQALALANQAVREPARFDAALCLPLVRRAGALVDEAMNEDVPEPASSPGHVIRANARGRHACYTALLHQLYLDAEDPALTRQIYRRLEALAQRSPFELSTLPVDLAWHRASQALSQGDQNGAEAALRAAAAHARELTHAELLWHSERALALLRMEREGGREAWDALHALHQRAVTQALHGIQAFCAYDACVYFDPDPNQPERLALLRAALLPSTHDIPALWAMKLRGLTAAGILDEARSALRRVPAQRLLALPHDGDFIGTLGHVTHAAVTLESADYYPVLERLLSPHETSFSAQVLGGYAGWVSVLLGMLAHAGGRHEEAVERLEQASAHHVQGRSPRGVETQLWLVKSLLALGRPRRALMVLGQAQADAQGLHSPGVKRLAQALRNEAQRARA